MIVEDYDIETDVNWHLFDDRPFTVNTNAVVVSKITRGDVKISDRVQVHKV